MINPSFGKIGPAVQAGLIAASRMDYGPIKNLDVVNLINTRPINDYHNSYVIVGQFIAGVSVWGSQTLTVSK